MGDFTSRLEAARAEVLASKGSMTDAVSQAKQSAYTDSAVSNALAAFGRRDSAMDTYNRSQEMPSSPIINTDELGVNWHQDGSFSYRTKDNKLITGLDEPTARRFAAEEQEKDRANAVSAPTSWLDTRRNAVGQTIADIGVQGAQAFTGFQTLEEVVIANNYGRIHSRPSTDDIKKFQQMQTDPEFAAANESFTKSRVYKNLQKDNKELQDNLAKYKIVEQFGNDVKDQMPVNRAEQIGAQIAFSTIAKNDGILAAAWNTMKTDLGTLAEAGIDSTPYMIAFTAGGPITQSAVLATLAVGKGNQAIAEFRQTNKREPTLEEVDRIRMWSAVSTVAEKLGDMAVTHAIPIAKIKWANQVLERVNKTLPGSIVNLAVVRPTIALAGEGASGAITSAADQMAASGRITDGAQIAFDAIAEAAGIPGGVAGMVATSAAVRGVKAAVAGTKAGAAAYQAAGEVSSPSSEPASPEGSQGPTEPSQPVAKTPVKEAELDAALKDLKAPGNPALEAIKAMGAKEMTPEQRATYEAALKKLNESMNAPAEGSKELGSLKSIDKLSDADLAEVQKREDLPAVDKAVVEGMAKVREAEKALAARDTEQARNKNLLDVNQDIKEGTDDRWTGFRTYLSQIMDASEEPSISESARQGKIEGSLANMATHLSNMEAKQAAFEEAQAAPAPKGQLRVVIGTRSNDAGKAADAEIQQLQTELGRTLTPKEKRRVMRKQQAENTDRSMNYEVSTMTAAEFKQARKDGKFVWNIAPRLSDRLIKNVQEEAAYGREMYNLAMNFQDSQFHEQAQAARMTKEAIKKTLDQLEAEALSQPGAELTDSEIASIGETKTDAPAKAKAAEDTAKSEKPTDGTPQAERTAVSESTATDAGTSEKAAPVVEDAAAVSAKPKADAKQSEKAPAAVDETSKLAPTHFLEIIQDLLGKSQEKGVKGSADPVYGKTLLELIKYKADNAIGNIPARLFGRPDELTAHLIEKMGLSEEAAKYLVSTFNTYVKFLDAQAKPLDAENPRRDALSEPMSMWKDAKTGKFPRNVAFALAIASTMWLKEHPLNERRTSSSEIELFLYGQRKSTPLTNDERREAGKVGHAYQPAAQSVGARVVKLLGISAANKDVEVYMEKLTHALGMAALQAWAQNPDHKYGLTIESHKWAFDSEEEGRSFETGKDFLHIVIGNSLTDKGINFTTAQNGIFKELSKKLLDGEQLSSMLPYQEPVEDVQKDIPGMFGKVPAKVRDVLKKLQNVAWTPTTSMAPFVELTQKHPNLVRELLGIVPLDKRLMPQSYYKSLKASNANKEQTVRFLLEGAEGGWLQKVYFKYRLMNQHRIMMQGQFSPQSSHITRYLLSPSKEVTYDASNLGAFKVAVMFNLGYKVDKERTSNIEREFDNLLETPAIKEAIRAYKAGETKAFGDALLKAQAIFGAELGVLSAVVALSNYAPFAAGETKSFKSDILLEVDGVTNGFAMLLQLLPTFSNPEDLEAFFNMTGTYFGNKPEDTTHLESGIYKGQAYVDAYVRLSKLLADPENTSAEAFAEYWANEPTILKAIDADAYNKASAALLQLYPWLAGHRNLAKSPFMVYQYGAGISSISRAMADEVLSAIYEKMYTLAKEPNREQVMELVSALKALKVDMPNGFIDKIMKQDLRGITLDEESIKRDVAVLLAPRLSQSLDLMLGETKTTRDNIVEAVEATYFVFAEHMKAAIAAAEKERGGVLSERAKRELVRTQLIHLLPQYRGPLMEADSNEFIDLVRSVAVNTEDYSKRVVYSFTPKGNQPGSRNSYPSPREIVSAGVSSLIRMVINMDSSIMTKTLSAHPEILTLYDAGMGSPEGITTFANGYNANYLELSQSVNIAEQVYNQLKGVIESTAPAMLDKANAAFLENGFSNEKRNKAAVSSKKESQARSLADMLELMSDEVEKVERGKEMIRQLSQERGGIVSHQMYAPSMKGPVDASSAVHSAETRELLDSLEDAQKQIILGSDQVAKWSAAARAALQRMLFTHGIAKTLEQLNAAVKGNPTLLVNLAMSDAQNSPRTIAFAKLIEKRVPNVDGAAIITSLLTQEGNELAVQQLSSTMSDVAMRSELNGIEQELKQYALKFDFQKSEFQGTEDTAELSNELHSLEDLPYENVEQTHSGDITLDTVRKLFNRFSRISEGYYVNDEAKAAHAATLSRVVDALARGLDSVSRIRLQVENIDGVTQGAFNPTRNRVRVSLSRQTPTAANSQSPQEVYVHELLHALTEHALKNTPLIGYEIRKVYQQTKAYVDVNGQHQVFLHGITNPTAEEVAMAKQQYRYLFDNPKNEANVLSEFLAYAVTNPALISYLSSTKVARPERGKGLLDTLIRMVQLAVDGFVRWMQGRRGNNAYQDMVAVMEQLVEIQAKHESKYSQAFNKITKVMDKGDEKLRALAERQAERVLARDPKNRLRKTFNAAVGGAVLSLSNNAAAAKVKLVAHKAVGNTLSRIASEIGDGSLTFALQKQLLISKNKISKARQDTERDFVDWFDKIWKGTDPKDISTETRNALTEVILRTDMSSLLNINMPVSQIAKLIGDFNLIELEKKKLLRQMGLNKVDRAIRYADELAEHIATGNTKMANGHSNVYTIAQLYIPYKSVEANPDLIKFLDAYTTLSAMQHNANRDTILVKDLIDREMATSPDDNAFHDILLYHNNFVKTSVQDLFGGNPIQAYKGWIIERTDNLHSLTTGTAADAEKMKKAGYTASYPLGQIAGVPQAHDTIYVSRNMPEVPYISGIMSMTNQRAMGTTIGEILGHDPKYMKVDGSIDHAAIAQEVKKIAKRQNSLAKSLATSPHMRLRPIRDDKGVIVDYRIMMNHETKKKLLEPDLQFQNVFAHMQSSYIDKTNTIINDKQTIDLLIAEWVDLYPSMPDRFVNIMDPNGPYYDRYRRLPNEVRRYLTQYAVQGKFMVREDIIDKVFGYTAYDLSQLKYFSKEGRERQKWVARLAHYMVKQVVSYGMDRVVIGTTNVVAGNLQSNLFQLSMRKISPLYSIKKMWEGFQEYQLYQADADRLRYLKREIEAKSLDVQNSPQAKEYFQIRTRMENNRIHRMSVAGLNSLIVEDLNDAAVNGYATRLDNLLENPKVTRFTKRVPPVLGTVAKTVFMTRSSYPYRISKKVVALSDFLARYVMIEHATTIKGQSFDQAMNEAVEAFVLFDENLSPPVEAFNAVGGTLFVSYWMRNQRAAKKLIKAHPTAVLTSAGIQHLTNIDTLANINSSFYGLDFAPNLLQLDDMLEKVYDPILITNLQGLLK